MKSKIFFLIFIIGIYILFGFSIVYANDLIIVKNDAPVLLGGENGTGNSLTITKTVEGNMGNKDKLFEFTINVNDSEFNDSIVTDYGTIEFDEGIAVVYLSDGDSITIGGLPANSICSITEDNEDYYVSTVLANLVDSNTADNVVEVELTTDETVNFTNTSELAVPTGISDLRGMILFGVCCSVVSIIVLVAIVKRKKV